MEDADNLHLLHRAVRRGYSTAVKALLQGKADVNGEEKLHFRPMHIACQLGWAEIVVILLENGAQVFYENKVIETPVGLPNVNVNAADKSQRTPLFFAAERGHLQTVNLLIEKEANSNSLDRREETVLFKPAGNGHTTVVKRLLEAGTNPVTLDFWNRTPLRFAALKDRVVVKQQRLARINLTGRSVRSYILRQYTYAQARK
ncbi:MAG: hypothetical protein LQ342_003951 [Letrouitia transgressa]|nr:MAG: hypothetical protein LQ342_003951 [Letrouitia transgressa]